ncbi:hypothetical protein MGA5115_03595 [Marinomonas gallaica]|uniref:Uncharacterized protein n=1 Tax=Marinomonas gallaica TaxID=1806667 RepID=A0A1C3JWJ6_9GAMM|nr:YacL family protein [Marinomonas gallaica]SBT19430.1 hypothetical protein MGA5115_03595 [Marinomonas gallaica]SBT22894.1 hypothetical protein MGA5116_03524 [Marinomonas gallaica]
MDYEIAFDQEEGAYRVIAEIEFAAIAEWVSEYLKDKEAVQRVWQAASLAEKDNEITEFQHGIFHVLISPEGVAVKRRVDMSQAEDEIKAMFDTQSGFFQASNDGVESECGLDDLIDLIENWHDFQQ